MTCAQSRNITAIYALDEGGYVAYILGAPDFVNRSFRALFTDGLPAIAPLIVKSDGVSAAGVTPPRRWRGHPQPWRTRLPRWSRDPRTA